MDEFSKYAVKHRGLNPLTLQKYKTISENYISPTIIEERQLNIATMDVFSRLMMDRIIFLGVPIDDYVANIIQAQLLFLESVDSRKDIQIYLNWVYTIPCSTSTLRLQPSVPVWQLQWELSCFVLVSKEKELR
jgi:hypothetical protein